MKCSECNPSECCKFDRLGSTVLTNVAEACNMTIEDFSKIFKQRETTSQGWCPYLSDDGTHCTIYNERPAVCRDYFCDEWEPEDEDKVL